MIPELPLKLDEPLTQLGSFQLTAPNAAFEFLQVVPQSLNRRQMAALLRAFGCDGVSLLSAPIGSSHFRTCPENGLAAAHLGAESHSPIAEKRHLGPGPYLFAISRHHTCTTESHLVRQVYCYQKVPFDPRAVPGFAHTLEKRIRGLLAEVDSLILVRWRHVQNGRRYLYCSLIALDGRLLY